MFIETILKNGLFFLLLFVSATAFGENAAKSPVKIRAGHFPNVTHAPALLGQAAGRFEKAFGETAQIEWKIFNAGPEAIEALSAGAVDILYVGPNPAVNGFVRSKKEALRILAGAASGGSAFVVRDGSGIKKFEDIRGKRVASPQIGNSQDVALRHLMSEKGIKSKTEGGDVEIFNLSGADQLTALLKGQVAGVWTVEPWVSRLVSEANGTILFDEKSLWPTGVYATSVLVARKKFLDEHPELVQTWVDAHVDIIRWMNQHKNEAKQTVNEELKRETGKALPVTYLDQSFDRILFTDNPMESSVRESANRAFHIGFLGKKDIDLADLYDLSFLNKANERPKGK